MRDANIKDIIAAIQDRNPDTNPDILTMILERSDNA